MGSNKNANAKTNAYSAPPDSLSLVPFSSQFTIPTPPSPTPLISPTWVGCSIHSLLFIVLSLRLLFASFCIIQVKRAFSQ